MRFCWGIEEVIFLRGLDDRYPQCVEQNDGETIEPAGRASGATSTMQVLRLRSGGHFL